MVCLSFHLYIDVHGQGVICVIFHGNYNIERMTWFKVVHCVNHELFPVLSIALKKCIDEKLSEDNNFKLDDFGNDVVDDIMERLKGRRTMNNKEMKYLKELFQRAVGSPQKSLVFSALCIETAISSRISCTNFHLTVSVCIQNQMLSKMRWKSARISVPNGPGWR